MRGSRRSNGRAGGSMGEVVGGKRKKDREIEGEGGKGGVGGVKKVARRVNTSEGNDRREDNREE